MALWSEGLRESRPAPTQKCSTSQYGAKCAILVYDWKRFFAEAPKTENNSLKMLKFGRKSSFGRTYHFRPKISFLSEIRSFQPKFWLEPMLHGTLLEGLEGLSMISAFFWPKLHIFGWNSLTAEWPKPTKCAKTVLAENWPEFRPKFPAASLFGDTLLYLGLSSSRSISRLRCARTKEDRSRLTWHMTSFCACPPSPVGTPHRGETREARGLVAWMHMQSCG